MRELKILGAVGIFVFFVTISSSCSKGGASGANLNLNNGVSGPPASSGPGGGGAGTGSSPICPSLSFAGVSWPSSLTSMDQEALQLALTISGSYEGNVGWANLANNFDGQGLSMGLLNQNLGTGSLQPLLIKMRDNHLSILQSIFSSGDLQNFLSMLLAWQSSGGMATQFLDGGRLSLLDVFTGGVISQASSANGASVQWAVSNVYSGNSFLPNWQTELTRLGQDPAYVSIQVEAALHLHANAVADKVTSGVYQLRSYLLMFDIQVQDGGMYSQDWTDFSSWLVQDPSASETAKLDELLQLRLRHVNSQYVSDVQSRKKTIIDGSGTVHGSSRNLEKEYCFNRLTPYQ